MRFEGRQSFYKQLKETQFLKLGCFRAFCWCLSKGQAGCTRTEAAVEPRTCLWPFGEQWCRFCEGGSHLSSKANLFSFPLSPARFSNRPVVAANYRKVLAVQPHAASAVSNSSCRGSALVRGTLWSSFAPSSTHKEILASGLLLHLHLRSYPANSKAVQPWVSAVHGLNVPFFRLFEGLRVRLAESLLNQAQRKSPLLRTREFLDSVQRPHTAQAKLASWASALLPKFLKQTYFSY